MVNSDSDKFSKASALCETSAACCPVRMPRWHAVPVLRRHSKICKTTLGEMLSLDRNYWTNHINVKQFRFHAHMNFYKYF